ncbi:hypothetical protein CAEBREN_02177 [Caenorhabditis brenneri]|uniref:WWE domain-containing protein n=1 Tax=Caenorhabditis brenneri TaxID=135651 RepID=G0NT17_CAEBE|nr:hypothetical protein CAEBREN_02177 [Caenorhabditis brenneri]
MGMECPMCREEIDSSQVEEHTVRCDVDVEMDCPEEYIEELGELFKSMDKKDKRKTPYEVSRRPERSTKRFYWLFEAKNKGWFRYDPKNERYIEECYKRKMDRADMWICGSNMTIDFKSNTQEKHDYFNTGTRRIRRIKASDLKTSRVRGIAGIDTVAFPLSNP